MTCDIASCVLRPYCGCIPSDSWQPEQPPLPLEDETVALGYVHVLTEHGGPCVDRCPHPEHPPLPLEDER